MRHRRHHQIAVDGLMGTIALGGVMLLSQMVACGSNPVQPQTGIAGATPSAETIAARMDLHHVTAYTATTDPDHLLGRQGGYTSKINWYQIGLPGEDTSDGGRNSIEVFSSNADLVARAGYLSAFRPPFGDGYDFSAGTALLRLDNAWTPTQAHAEEARFSAAVTTAAPTIQSGPQTSASSSGSYPADWTLPNRTLTPGAIGTTNTALLCPRVSSALEAARPSGAEKDAVYRAYGITSRSPGQYEVDHLVPIELGGAPDSQANLWPEPNDSPSPADISRWRLSPAFVHNSKDILEDALHEQVCAGQISLATAQTAIRNDWRSAYVKYVRKTSP